TGDLDAMLTALVVLAMLQLVSPARSVFRDLLLGLTLATIFLLKSFALLPILAVIGAYAFFLPRVERPSVAALARIALPLVAAVVLWGISRWIADGSPWFLLQMTREDLVLRTAQAIDKGAPSRLGYLPTILDRFAPWPLLVLPYAALAWRRRKRPWRP